MKNKLLILMAIILWITISLPVMAYASSIDYLLNVKNDTMSSLDGYSYFAKLTVKWVDGSTSAHFTLSVNEDIVNDLSEGDDHWGFIKFAWNADGAALLTDDDVAQQTGWNFKADTDNVAGYNGFGKFDYEITLNGMTNRIDPLEFDINFQTAVQESFYYQWSDGGDDGPVHFAAHLGIDPYDTSNPTGYIADGGSPVPEPATMLLLGSGLVGLAGFGRRKFKKN